MKKGNFEIITALRHYLLQTILLDIDIYAQNIQLLVRALGSFYTRLPFQRTLAINTEFNRTDTH